MISQPKVPDSLDTIYGIEEFLEFNDTIKECHIQDDVLKDFSLDELIISYSKVKNVNFSNSNLPKAYFNDVIFENCDFSLVNLEKSTFKRVVFINCKFTGTVLTGTYFDNVSFKNSYMLGIILNDSNFISAEFIDCNMKEAQLSNITFKNYNF